MIRTLKGTTSAGIQNAIAEARQSVGTASGMVFTLLVFAESADYDEVFDACVEAGREHPSRIILTTDGSARADRVDAELHIGESVPGEIIALKFHGELVNHKSSVLRPLLLPDSPVIAWWPGVAPDPVAQDPLGKLAGRRITDAMGCDDPLGKLIERAHTMSRGDTDLTWTRLTPWRALLAAALDVHQAPVRAASVHAAANNAGGLLMAAWLGSRLALDVDVVASDGPGITEVTLVSDEGEIRLARPDGKMATFTAPNSPPRSVALRRREVSALITEELRRLDTDEVFEQSMKALARRFDGGEPAAAKGSE